VSAEGFGPTDPREAKLAIADSQRRLREVRSQGRVVESVARRLEYQLKRNHFGERMALAYDRIPTPH
jgi:hypothetical protein